MSFRQKVLIAFKLHGLVPTTDSVKAICEHMSNAAEPLDELSRILQHLKGNSKCKAFDMPPSFGPDPNQCKNFAPAILSCVLGSMVVCLDC